MTDPPHCFPLEYIGDTLGKVSWSAIKYAFNFYGMTLSTSYVPLFFKTGRTGGQGGGESFQGWGKESRGSPPPKEEPLGIDSTDFSLSISDDRHDRMGISREMRKIMRERDVK